MLLGLAVLHLRDLHLLGHLLMHPVRVMLQGQVFLLHHVLVVVLMMEAQTRAFNPLLVHLVVVSLVESLDITLGTAPLRLLPHLAPMRLRCLMMLLRRNLLLRDICT